MVVSVYRKMERGSLIFIRKAYCAPGDRKLEQCGAHNGYSGNGAM